MVEDNVEAPNHLQRHDKGIQKSWLNIWTSWIHFLISWNLTVVIHSEVQCYITLLWSNQKSLSTSVCCIWQSTAAGINGARWDGFVAVDLMSSISGLSESGNPVPFALCCLSFTLPNSAGAFLNWEEENCMWCWWQKPYIVIWQSTVFFSE